MKVVFRKTVVGDWCFYYLSGSHLQSQVKSRRQMMVFMPLVLVLIGQFCRDQIGYPHPEDHDKPITDTPGFKPFTIVYILIYIKGSNILQTAVYICTADIEYK